MKLIKTVSLLLCLALVAAFAGCGKKAEPPKTDGTTVSAAEKETEQASEDTAEASEEDTTAEETETEAQPTTVVYTTADESGWRSAYREYLFNKLAEEGPQTMNEFALLYIDADDVPELVVTEGPGAHGFGYTVLTFSGGKVVEVANDAQVFWFFERQGVMAFSGSSGAYSGGASYYKMDGAKSEVIDELLYEYGEGYIDVPKYTINGREVSEEEYNAVEGKYEKKYGAKSDFSGFPLRKESIENNV